MKQNKKLPESCDFSCFESLRPVAAVANVAVSTFVTPMCPVACFALDSFLDEVVVVDETVLLLLDE